MRAISLLSALKFRNGMRTLLTDPRKLVPFLIFLVIVAGSIALALWGIERHITPGIRATLRGDEFSAGVLIALILLGLGFIDSGLGDNLLAFGASDVDYLFPSPISRRLILAYRLPGLMFGNMFMAGFALFAFGFATQFWTAAYGVSRAHNRPGMGGSCRVVSIRRNLYEPLDVHRDFGAESSEVPQNFGFRSSWLMWGNWFARMASRYDCNRRRDEVAHCSLGVFCPLLLALRV